MTKVFVRSAMALAVASLLVGSAPAQLTHRYSFDTDLTDSVGDADGTALGDAFVLGGQALVNLTDGARNGRIDLLANGANGININTYSATTIEFWATPNCDSADACAPNPNNGFHTALGLGKTYGPPDLPAPEIGPTGAGADYIIVQTHRGDNVSRGAIAVTKEETLGAPWGAETGANGPELNDGGQHHYAVVIDASELSFYVDGVLGGTTPLANPNSHGNGNFLSGVSNQNVWIGSAYEIDPRWAGAMNELRFWNKAASSSYLANSFAAGPDSLTNFIEKVVVPEPATLTVLSLGLCGLWGIGRRARN